MHPLGVCVCVCARVRAYVCVCVYIYVYMYIHSQGHSDIVCSSDWISAGRIRHDATYRVMTTHRMS